MSNGQIIAFEETKGRKTMKSIKNWVTAGAFSLLILGIPAIASAQYGQYDPYSRNGGYNNGTYGSYGDMRSIVRSLKSRTRQFTSQLDRDLDRSRLDGTRREDQIMDLARDFKNSVDRLSNSGNYGRRDNNVERALQLGSQLERAIGRARLSQHSRMLWSGIRGDLQMLGNGYGYDNRRNRGNRNGGGWGSGNNTPSWWPF
jgi:hypothetical protein